MIDNMNKEEKNEKYLLKNIALKEDYVAEGQEAAGYTIIPVYRDNSFLLRTIRTVWFKLKLPQKIWFNKSVNQIHADTLIVYDAQVTSDYLKWLCENHPDSKIHFQYCNRIAFAQFTPDDIHCDNLLFYSFDQDDCNRYGMNFVPAGYLDHYAFSESEKLPPQYDVIYLGRDKGRAEKLLELQRQFEELGLKTYFHICADRTFLRYKKSFYKPALSYADYVELLKRTRSHLNYVQEGQTSVTQRDMESVFDSVKCITNNKGIFAFELYDPSRFFVLGVDDIQTLPKFLNTPFKPVSAQQLDKYRA